MQVSRDIGIGLLPHLAGLGREILLGEEPTCQRCRYHIGAGKFMGSGARQIAACPARDAAGVVQIDACRWVYISSRYPEVQRAKTRRLVMSRAAVDGGVRSASSPSRRAPTRTMVVRFNEYPAQKVPMPPADGGYEAGSPVARSGAEGSDVSKIVDPNDDPTLWCDGRGANPATNSRPAAGEAIRAAWRSLQAN
jgi:hypothetical protein